MMNSDSRLRRNLPLVFTLAAWLIALAVVNPRGNFSLIDDANYAESAWILLRTGHYFVAECTNSISVAQVLFGALIAKYFGSSYETLRLTTICFGTFGLIGCYCALRLVDAGRNAAILGTIIVAVNPIYVVLCCTFMTDIPFFALETASIYFFVRALTHQKHSIALICLGTALTIAAVFTRQFGVAVPLAFTATYLLCYGFRPKTALIAVMPTILVFSLLGIFQWWAKKESILPPGYATFQYALNELAALGVRRALLFEVKRFLDVWSYLGLFILPILILVRHQLSKKQVLVLLACAVVITIPITYKNWLMPLSNDLFHGKTLGMLSLRDSWQIKSAPSMVRYVWAVLTVSSLVSGALLLLYAFRLFKEQVQVHGMAIRCSSKVTTFAVSLLLFYFLPLVIWQQKCERYYLPLILPALILMVPYLTPNLIADKLSKSKLAVAVLLLVVTAIYSIVGTHDYFAWNRARWELLDQLTANSTILTEDIDGGYEFNFLHFHFHGKHSCWFYETRPSYVVAFRNLNGYQEIDSREFEAWMPGSCGRVVLLKKIPTF